MLRITAIIIAKNEGDRIHRCISSIREVVTEIIVLDSGSTDDTLAICKSLGATVYSVAWQGYGNTKNLGHTYASNDWILSIDADEQLDKDLAKSIQSIEESMPCVYSMNRKNFYLGKEVKYSGWSPDWVFRLYHKDVAAWNSDLVHEKLLVQDSTVTKRLKGHLLHDSYRSIEDHLQKMDIYAQLKAKSWIANGSPPSKVKYLLGPFAKWMKSYILKGGILDGRAGWIISRMNYTMIKKQLYYYDEFSKNA